LMSRVPGMPTGEFGSCWSDRSDVEGWGCVAGKATAQGQR
jgi:hypothetical protein